MKAFFTTDAIEQLEEHLGSVYQPIMDSEGRVAKYRRDRSIFFPWKDNIVVQISRNPTLVEVLKYEDGWIYKYEKRRYAGIDKGYVKLGPSPYLFDDLTDISYVDDVRTYIKHMYILHLAVQDLSLRSIPRELLPDLENYIRDPFNHEPSERL